MIRRITLEFTLDDEQTINLKNHCQNDEELLMNIKAMFGAELQNGDVDNDLESLITDIKNAWANNY